MNSPVASIAFHLSAWLHVLAIGSFAGSRTISDELARRGYLHPLVARYWTESSPEVRDGIEHVAYHFQSSEAASFMREVLAKHLDDGEDLYWPVNYLSKKCEHAALAKLKSGRYRNQGSLQYQESVALFGKCAYRPAIPYLVDSALYDVSLNVVDAADSSLRRLFPGTPKEFDSLEQEQNYFCARAKRLGVQVHCHLQTCVIQ